VQFCGRHWQALRQAIDARGLGHTVAANGRDAFARAAAELQGKAELADFDALMAAHNMIVAKVTERVGLSLFVTKEICPVCEGIKTNAGVVDPTLGRVYTDAEEESYWIDGPADAMLSIAKHHGIDKPLISSSVTSETGFEGETGG
jgi:hypothetical protein